MTFEKQYIYIYTDIAQKNKTFLIMALVKAKITQTLNKLYLSMYWKPRNLFKIQKKIN